MPDDEVFTCVQVIDETHDVRTFVLRLHDGARSFRYRPGQFVTLALDIDGPTAGNGAGHHDQLVLTGANSVYTAGGTIAPITRGITGSANNTYTPQIGDSFQVVSAEGGVTGSFTAIAQPTSGLAENTRFDVLYLPKAVVLSVKPTQPAVRSGPHQDPHRHQ